MIASKVRDRQVDQNRWPAMTAEDPRRDISTLVVCERLRWESLMGRYLLACRVQVDESAGRPQSAYGPGQHGRGDPTARSGDPVPPFKLVGSPTMWFDIEGSRPIL